MGEGFYWDALGDYDMATTQLRLTNVVSSLAVIALLMLAPEGARKRLAHCGALVRLGDLSFGAYLCHVVLIMVLRKALGLIGLAGAPSIFALWALALGLSVLLANAGRHVLPHRVRELVLGTES